MMSARVMMSEVEQRALAALRFNWAPTPDDVWRPSPFHVDGLHRDAVELVMGSVAEIHGETESSPVGVAVQGQRGTGKTHLLGTVRERVQAAGGYFFLVSLLDAPAFWQSVALSILDGFGRESGGRTSQLKTFLRHLGDRIEAPRAVRRAISGDATLARPTLDAFGDLLRKTNRQVGIECQDTARALVLHASEDADAQMVGYDFLCAGDEVEPGERARWGMRRGKRSAQEIVRDISRLLALTGPTVIAVDQIDVLIKQSAKSTEGDSRAEWRMALLLEQIAGGLMSLRETTRRTLSVVACLPSTWDMIKTRATDTVQDRFREAVYLGQLPSADLGRQLVEKRFAVRFAETGFEPPYPSWPILPSAFGEATLFTPRGLLRVIDTHVRACQGAGEIREMARLVTTDAGAGAPPPADATPESTIDLAAIDAQFAALTAEADPDPALDPQTEDTVVPALLRAGLTAWIGEHGEAGETFGIDPQPAGKPALHARLRLSLGEDSDDEAHWAFRAISAPHHISVLNRMRNAMTAAGLGDGVPERRLFLLRERKWAQGARTQETLETLRNAGGEPLGFSKSDVQTLWALRELIEKHGYETLKPWFRARRPASSIEFLRTALAEAEATATAAPTATLPAPVLLGRDPSYAESDNKGPFLVESAAAAHRIRLGTAVTGGGDVFVDLEALRRHTAIFAGSGSGKTVLIRRLVEECALRGVSAIVLDPNNDLARLGDPWPAPPSAWSDGDAGRAEEYLRTTDVVVWTPRRETGRPLSFQPLPDFAQILDDPDAFATAVDAAVASLLPRARVDGASAKALIGQAVLREALTSYARTGASDLKGFIGFLNALPDGVSQLDDAGKIAADMAQLLTAAVVTDPLFGGSGLPVDPGLLLTPAPGRRARVSVISFIGLADDAQRQSFVNQLQLALFSWIKRHPAGDRPLGGLLVMDEAQTLAPSGAMTACTKSTVALASQARKYGLGLVFATQAPKGLHNVVTGNAATQLFGLLNHPTHIAAARELARAKGSDIADIGRLGTGQFYAAIEGAEFQKLKTPLCLTHHPKSPLTAEDVLDRAKR